MFLLDGKPLSPDVAFTDINGIQRPANWLRLASAEERRSAGVKEAPDSPSYDQRFYWGYTEDGKLLPKDHLQLVEQWIEQTKTTASSLLSQSDWMVTRSAEPSGKPVPQEVLARRQQIRQLSNEKEAVIKATTTTYGLAAYVTGPGYARWEPEPALTSAGDIADEVVDGFDPSLVSGVFG